MKNKNEYKKLIKKLKERFRLKDSDFEDLDTGELKIYAKILEVDFYFACDAVAIVIFKEDI